MRDRKDFTPQQFFLRTMAEKRVKLHVVGVRKGRRMAREGGREKDETRRNIRRLIRKVFNVNNTKIEVLLMTGRRICMETTLQDAGLQLSSNHYALSGGHRRGL